MTAPSLGRTVIVYGVYANGSDRHPGVVTRVWSPTVVNATVFPDGAQPVTRGSIDFYASEREAMDVVRHASEMGLHTPTVAYYPPRVA
jgi:hypothetical protein